MIDILTFKSLNDIKPMDIGVVGKTLLPLVKGGGYNILSGRGGTGKSMLALSAMIDYAIKNKSKNVLGIFTEDGKSTIEQRMWTVCKNRYSMSQLDFKELLERFLFMTVEMLEPLTIVEYSNNRMLQKSKVVDQLIQIIVSRNIGFVIFDPLKYFHQQDENSNSEMKIVMSSFSKIGIDTGAVVLVLHHSAKGASGARGAGCIEDDSRLAYSLANKMIRNKDGSVTIDEAYRGLVKLSVEKDNYRVFDKFSSQLFEDTSKMLIRLFPTKGIINNAVVIEYKE